MEKENISIKIKQTDSCLVATMPNGDVIPMQIDLIITNKLDRMKFVDCTITLTASIPIKDFDLIKDHPSVNVDKL